jgi:methyl-accepting chemotaxis protein
MTWFKNRSIGVKLSFLVGVPLFMLILNTAMNYRTSELSARETADAYQNVFSQAANITQVRSNLNSEQRSILKMVLIEDRQAMKEMNDDVEKRRKESAAYLKEFEATPIDKTAREYLNEANEIKSKFVTLQDQVIALALENQDAEARKLLIGELEPTAMQYTAILRKMSAYLVEKADETNDEMFALSKASIRSGLAVAAAATVLSVLVSVFVSRLITKPINVMKEKIGLFAAGDLNVDFTDKGRDAISQMSNALAEMASSLRRVVATIQDSGIQIAESSQNFSAMAQETNASVEEFRANIEEMGTNLTQLASTSEVVNASVEEVAAGAQTTAEKGTDIARKVDDAMEVGNSGMKTVRDVVTEIESVVEGADTAKGAVMQLTDNANKIQGFVAQIAGIADQTNLLALNAAIEAARAGDAGRGFAVVAEEVRKLAEDSNVAAKNIEGLAGTIMEDLDLITKCAVDNMAQCQKAGTLSGDTESAIAKMLANLRDIATATQDLAAVAEEQAASSEEIAEAVQSMATKVNVTANAGENIRIGVTEVAAASEKVATDAEGLSRLSGSLHDELAFFKLDDAAGQGEPSKKEKPAEKNPRKMLKAGLAATANA